MKKKNYFSNLYNPIFLVRKTKLSLHLQMSSCLSFSLQKETQCPHPNELSESEMSRDIFEGLRERDKLSFLVEEKDPGAQINCLFSLLITRGI